MKHLFTYQKSGLNNSRKLTGLFASLITVASFTASATDVSIYGGQVNGLSVEHEIVNDWGVFIGAQYNAHSELTGKINGYTFDVPLQTFGLVLEKRFVFGQSDFSIGVNGGAQFLLEDITILEHQDTSPRNLLSKKGVIPTLGINAKYKFSEKLNLLAGTQYLFETSPLDQQLSFYVGVSYSFGDTGSHVATKTHTTEVNSAISTSPELVTIDKTQLETKEDTVLSAMNSDNSTTVEVVTEESIIKNMTAEDSLTDEATSNIIENNKQDMASLACLQAGAFKNSYYFNERLSIVDKITDKVIVGEQNGFSFIYLVFDKNEEREGATALLKNQGIDTMNITCSKISAMN